MPKSLYLNSRHAELLPDGRLLMDVGWRSPDKQQAVFDSAWFIWSSKWSGRNYPLLYLAALAAYMALMEIRLSPHRMIQACRQSFGPR